MQLERHCEVPDPVPAITADECIEDGPQLGHHANRPGEAPWGGICAGNT